MNIRRAGQVLLEVALPLYGIASTPERRHYWKNLSLWRSAKLLSAVFFILSSVAFIMDLFAAKDPFPLGAVLVMAAVFGGLNVLFVLAELRHPALLFPVLIVILGAIFVFLKLPRKRHPSREEIVQRTIFDTSCLITVILLSYRLFLSFTTTEGVTHVQLQTELSFAHAIQNTLVPPIAHKDSLLEIYGRTLPSEMVGGDLVDVVIMQDSTMAYLADVSGHGIPAGVLMGMVKTAMRQGARMRQSLPDLLDGVNGVLPAVKEPHMYATLAGLKFERNSGGETKAEYILAGHFPLLHYRKSANDVMRCGMEQFPLGLLPGVSYNSNCRTCGPGDLFAIMSDGLTETEDAKGEEFGLARVEELLLRLADKPLPEIFESVIAAVAHHGKQQDDRTLLLLRILPRA